MAVGVGPEDVGGVGPEGVGGIAGGVGNGGLGRTRIGGNGGIDDCIAGVVKNMVDAIEKGRWEQVVGPEVVREEQVVVRDLGRIRA